MMKRMSKRIMAFLLGIAMIFLAVPSITANAARDPKELAPAISNAVIVSNTGVEYLPKNGVIDLNTNGIYRFKVDFDLTAFDGDLVDGDYFTLTIPALVHVDDANFSFTHTETGVEIAKAKVVSNGTSQGGTVTITLQNLSEYLNKTGGETVRDVKGTFFVAFTFKEEVSERTITFTTPETTNAISYNISVTKPPVEDSTERIGDTNFEKRMIGMDEDPFTSDALGRSFPFLARWLGRINVNQQSYDKIVVTDTITIDDGYGPMQFIPEKLTVHSGYFATEGYGFQYEYKMVLDQDYTIEYNESYTEFVITINNPKERYASNGNPASYLISYWTSVPGDGTQVGNSLKMTADDQVLTELVSNTKTESIQEGNPSSTSGGTISIDTSYSIVLFKVDSVTAKPLPGAIFKVITPSGEEIELDPTDEDGRVQSRQFTSQEAAAGDFTVVEVTAPNGYKLDTTPFTVTVGQSAVVRTIKNEPVDVSGSVELEATKELTGRDIVAEEFSFTVTEDGEEVISGKNDATGKITFDEITYSRDDIGEHIYTITEDAGNLVDVTYSEESFEVKVVVSVNESDPTKLDTVITYPEGYILRRQRKQVTS